MAMLQEMIEDDNDDEYVLRILPARVFLPLQRRQLRHPKRVFSLVDCRAMCSDAAAATITNGCLSHQVFSV